MKIDIINPAIEAQRAPNARGAITVGIEIPSPPPANKNIPPNIRPVILAIRRFPCDIHKDKKYAMKIIKNGTAIIPMTTNP